MTLRELREQNGKSRAEVAAALGVAVQFSCGYGWVKAKVFADDYGIPESVRMFAGDTAAEDCIRWAASKAVEVFETVTARTAPYKDGMMKYKMALQGGNV